VVVTIQVTPYQGPKSYALSRNSGSVVTLTTGDVNSQLSGPAWQSTDGTLVIESTGFAGSIQARLVDVSQAQTTTQEIRMDGHWSCASN